MEEEKKKKWGWTDLVIFAVCFVISDLLVNRFAFTNEMVSFISQLIIIAVLLFIFYFIKYKLFDKDKEE